MHIAFKAMNREMVRKFHEVALANGGSDAGPPGERRQYDAHYFGAFVYDPTATRSKQSR